MTFKKLQTKAENKVKLQYFFFFFDFLKWININDFDYGNSFFYFASLVLIAERKIQLGLQSLMAFTFVWIAVLIIATWVSCFSSFFQHDLNRFQKFKTTKTQKTYRIFWTLSTIFIAYFSPPSILFSISIPILFKTYVNKYSKKIFFSLFCRCSY